MERGEPGIVNKIVSGENFMAKKEIKKMGAKPSDSSRLPSTAMYLIST